VRQSKKERTYRRLNKAKNFLLYKRRQCKKNMKKKLLSNLLHRQADYARCHYGPTVVGGEGGRET